MKNIVLTGFMGSGKSSVGEIIAKRLGMKVIDTDDLIEEKMRMSINDIFSRYGEPHFRDVETGVVKEASKLDGHVIITGGGVVLNKSNIENLRTNGVIVYLHVSPEDAFDRVKAETHRPLLKVDDPLGKIRELIEFREPFYADNEVQVDTTRLSVDEVAGEVVERVKPLLSS